jgi:hypothetical protein
MAVAEDLKLVRLVFVRTLAVDTGWPKNVRRQGGENGWDNIAAVGGSEVIQLRVKPYKDLKDMVAGVPAVPLTPAVYVLTGGTLKNPFVFSIHSEEGERKQCVDVSCKFAMMAEECLTRPCASISAGGDASVGNSTSASTETATARRAGIGFRVKTDQLPVFTNSTGPETKGALPIGAFAANAKGSILGAPREYSLEQSNGRTRVLYLKPRENGASFLAIGWVETDALDRFAYDCSCGKSERCEPVNATMRGSTWNSCFTEGAATLPKDR